MSTDSRLEHAPVNLSARQRAQNLIAALPLPDGTLAVGVGLVVSGITTYLFQILAFRGLSKPDYGALNALWVFVFVLAPGIFLPVEQEVGRALARAARARHRRRARHPPRRTDRLDVRHRARDRHDHPRRSRRRSSTTCSPATSGWSSAS